MDYSRYDRWGRDDFLDEIERLLERQNQLSEGIERLTSLLDTLDMCENHPDVVRACNELEALL